MEDFAGGEAEAGSPPSTAQMPSNERRQVRIALAPSRTVASTLVSCRQAGARPVTPQREKKEKEQSPARPSRTGRPEPNSDLRRHVVAVTQLPRQEDIQKKRGAPKI